jgi:hypothetical protein
MATSRRGSSGSTIRAACPVKHCNMPQSFTFRDYKCELSADYPVAFSKEQESPTFLEELAATGKLPKNLSKKDLVSWIIARFTELTYGGLMFEDNEFANDGGDFAYRLKVCDSSGKRIGWWGIVFWPDRIQLCGSAEPHAINGQTLIVEMLTESPRELGKCKVTIRDPDTRTKKTFGWGWLSIPLIVQLACQIQRPPESNGPTTHESLYLAGCWPSCTLFHSRASTQ